MLPVVPYIPVGRLDEPAGRSSTVEEVSVGQGDHAVLGDILRQVCYAVLFMRKETTVSVSLLCCVNVKAYGRYNGNNFTTILAVVILVKLMCDSYRRLFLPLAEPDGQ